MSCSIPSPRNYRYDSPLSLSLSLSLCLSFILSREQGATFRFRPTLCATISVCLDHLSLVVCFGGLVLSFCLREMSLSSLEVGFRRSKQVAHLPRNKCDVECRSSYEKSRSSVTLEKL
jgi:hypothetical protein